MEFNLAKPSVKKLTVSAMLMALGLVLPFLSGQIPQIGSMMLPMHLPVLLCGLICGWQYGGVVGFILPLFRHALFAAPPMPTAVIMAFELAAYGLVSGFLYGRCRRQGVAAVYRCLIAAMAAGRVVWAGVTAAVLGLAGTPLTWQLFLSGALLNAIPGIALQLLLIPAVMAAMDRTGFVPFQGREQPPRHGEPDQP